MRKATGNTGRGGIVPGSRIRKRGKGAAAAWAPALAAFAVLALLISAAGCRKGQVMDLSEYKKSISEIHDGVAWDLSYVLESMSGLSVEDYYNLEELKAIFQEAKDIFTTAYRESDSLSPPEEALDLHQELMRFYARGEEEIGMVVNGLGLFQIVLPMLADMGNLALPNLPEQPRPEEIRAAAEEDHRTMDMYLGEIEGIVPPEELHSYLETLRDLFRSVRDRVAGLEQVAPPGEMEALAQFRQDHVSASQKVEELKKEASGYLSGIGGKIDALIEKGAALAVGIQKL